MHDEILRAIGFAVPLLLLAWYANRIRHPDRPAKGKRDSRHQGP